MADQPGKAIELTCVTLGGVPNVRFPFTNFADPSYLAATQANRAVRNILIKAWSDISLLVGAGYVHAPANVMKIDFTD